MTHADTLDYDFLAAAYEARLAMTSPITPISQKGECAAEQVELQALVAVDEAMPHPCFPYLDDVSA